MRKSLSLIALVCFVGLFGALSIVSAQDTIAVGDTVSGEITEGAVTYNFDAVAGEVVNISIVAEGFEPDLEVNDADGWEVEFNFGGDTSASLVFVAPVDGTYTIVSQDFLDPVTGSYTLSLSAGNTMATGEVAEGTIDTAPVAYTFDGVAGTLVAIAVTTAEFDSNIELYDAEGDAIRYATTSTYSPNNAIEIVLPEDGQYTVGLMVGSYSDSMAGTYSIALTELSPEIVEFDVTTPITIEGVDRQYVAFKAVTGDVVHIVADGTTADGTEGIDVELELVAPDGTDLVSDTSDGPGFNPVLTRIILPVDGFYLLKVIPESDAPDQAGVVNVTIETTQLQMLDEGDVTLTLGDTDRFEQDYMHFNAEAGGRYRLTVTPDRAIVSFNVAIGEGFIVGDSNVSVTDVDNLVFDFTSEDGGFTAISLRQSSWQADTTYTVSLETLP